MSFELLPPLHSSLQKRLQPETRPSMLPMNVSPQPDTTGRCFTKILRLFRNQYLF
jgi:hypothetical protein